MLNLLTQRERKSIKREYIVRAVAVGTVLALFTVVFAIAGIMPAYFQATVDLKIKTADLEQLSIESEREGDDTVALALTRTDTVLGFIDITKKDKTLSTDIIRSALNARPSGVSVHALSFESVQDELALVVSGRAQTRAGLIEFSRRIEEGQGFNAVNVPAGDLAQTENINFRLTVQGDF